jgi:hypothetical protein
MLKTLSNLSHIISCTYLSKTSKYFSFLISNNILTDVLIFIDFDKTIEVVLTLIPTRIFSLKYFKLKKRADSYSSLNKNKKSRATIFLAQAQMGLFKY